MGSKALTTPILQNRPKAIVLKEYSVILLMLLDFHVGFEAVQGNKAKANLHLGITIQAFGTSFWGSMFISACPGSLGSSEKRMAALPLGQSTYGVLFRRSIEAMMILLVVPVSRQTARISCCRLYAVMMLACCAWALIPPPAITEAASNPKFGNFNF